MIDFNDTVITYLDQVDVGAVAEASTSEKYILAVILKESESLLEKLNDAQTKVFMELKESVSSAYQEEELIAESTRMYWGVGKGADAARLYLKKKRHARLTAALKRKAVRDNLIKNAKMYGISAGVLLGILATFVPEAVGTGIGYVLKPVISSAATVASSALQTAGSAGATVAPVVPSAAATVAEGALTATMTIGTTVFTYVVAPIVGIAILLGIGLLVEHLLTKRRFRKDLSEQVKKYLGTDSEKKLQKILLILKNEKKGSKAYEDAQVELDAMRQSLLEAIGEQNAKKEGKL